MTALMTTTMMQTAPCGGLLTKGRGKEAVSPGWGGGTGRYIVGNHSIWYSPCSGHLLQVSCESSLSGGQQLASSGKQPLKSMALDKLQFNWGTRPRMFWGTGLADHSALSLEGVEIMITMMLCGFLEHIGVKIYVNPVANMCPYHYCMKDHLRVKGSL